MTSISLWGERGRMGAELKKAVGAFSELKLISYSHSTQGVIDFSSAQGLMDLLKKLDDQKNPAWVVSGSTGLDDDQKKKLEQYAKTRPILWAANFSVGVFALSRILEFARTLPELQTFEPKIRETHHVHKKDSPSGTALVLKSHLPGATPIESIREGEVIGDHEVWFESASERIGLCHRAKTRAVFAEGALKSAILLTQKLAKNQNGFPKRLLTLEDVFSS